MCDHLFLNHNPISHLFHRCRTPSTTAIVMVMVALVPDFARSYMTYQVVSMKVRLNHTRGNTSTSSHQTDL
jgi:hypothetical protein